MENKKVKMPQQQNLTTDEEKAQKALLKAQRKAEFVSFFSEKFYISFVFRLGSKIQERT